jgi:hypothetical protein
MRKLLPLFLALLLFSCAQPETIIQRVDKPFTVRAYDSAWTITEAGYLLDDGSLPASFSSYVSGYNGGHIADHLTVRTGEAIVQISEAPTARATIVRPLDDFVLKSYSDIPRAQVAALRNSWQSDALALGGTLYIDNDPPAYHFELPLSPPAVAPSDPYYLYAAYVVHSTDGAIKYEQHFTTAADRDYYISAVQEYEVAPWNASNPSDPLGWVWGQKYEMPSGVEKR